MGVTIHFQGQLKDRGLLEETVRIIERYAKSRNWGYRKINTRQIHILPSENCDPLHFEFDESAYLEKDFCKTQFAGSDIHIQIIGLFKSITKNFSTLEVFDEGGFWDSGERQELERNFAACVYALERYLQQNPNARGPIRSPEGRWIDVKTF